MAPFNRAQIIMQTQGTNPKITSSYKGIINCVRRINTEEGFKALWRGTMPDLLKEIPIPVAMFFTQAFLMYKLASGKEPQTGWEAFRNLLIVNLGSTATGVLIGHPFELARIHLANDMGSNQLMRNYTGMIDFWRKVRQKNGISGLYKGVASTLGYYLSRSAIIMGFGVVSPHVLTRRGELMISFEVFMSKFKILVAVFLLYPLETVRKRIMMQAARSSANSHYSNVFDCCRKMYQQEGFRSFYGGFSLTLLRIFGLVFPTFLFLNELAQVAKDNEKEDREGISDEKEEDVTDF